jgi:hypothetical protein
MPTNFQNSYERFSLELTVNRETRTFLDPNFDMQTSSIIPRQSSSLLLCVSTTSGLCEHHLGQKNDIEGVHFWRRSINLIEAF